MRRPRLLKSTSTPSEASIQESICSYLTSEDIEYSITDASVPYVNSKPRKGKVKPGWPDITGVMPAHSSEPGRALFIEVKSKRGRLRPRQIEVIGRLRDSGARVIVAFSLEDMIDELSPLLSRKVERLAA